MSNNQFTTTRFPVRTIPLVTSPRRRFVELLAASILGAALALVAAWLLFVPAPTPAPLAAVPAPILIMATAPLPPVAPTSYPTPTPTVVPTAVPTEAPTEAPAPVVRAEPIQEAAPAVAAPTWFPTTVAAWCESGCEPTPAPPDPATVPTSEVFDCYSGCGQVWGEHPIEALPEINAHPLPPVQPINVDQAGKAGA